MFQSVTNSNREVAPTHNGASMWLIDETNSTLSLDDRIAQFGPKIFGIQRFNGNETIEMEIYGPAQSMSDAGNMWCLLVQRAGDECRAMWLAKNLDVARRVLTRVLLGIIIWDLPEMSMQDRTPLVP